MSPPAPGVASFEDALRHLADESARPDARAVRLLSAPSRAELALWRELWPAIDTERRRWIARRLLEIAEATFEVDFEDLCLDMLADEDADVRVHAIDGLWESRNARLVPLFTDLLAAAETPVRAHAASALGPFVLMGELSCTETEGLQAAVGALIALVGDPDEQADVRRRALESLGYADREEVRDLIRLAHEGSEPSLRAGALRAMGRSADTSWGPEVTRALEGSEPELRFEAARATGELGLREAVPALFAMAEGDEPQIRLEAVWALGEIGGPAARKALERLASRADDEVLVEAVDEALATAALGDEEIDWSALGPL